MRECFDFLDEAEVANLLLGTLERTMATLENTLDALNDTARALGTPPIDAEPMLMLTRQVAYGARARLLELRE